LIGFKGSNPAGKMILFQNAIINLLSATDDDTTKGTVKINNTQVNILEQVTPSKGLSLSSITAQTKNGTSFPIGTELSDTEQNPPKYNSYSSDEESVTTGEPTAETKQIANGNKSGEGDSVKYISDKLESDAGADNADNGSCTHDNEKNGCTQDSDKKPHETTGQAPTLINNSPSSDDESDKGNNSGTKHSVKDTSDKNEPAEGANNANRTTQSSTKKDDPTQHDGKPDSSKLNNSNVHSGEDNNKDKSVNDKGSCTHDNEKNGGTQDSDKKSHDTTGQPGTTDKKRKLAPKG